MMTTKENGIPHLGKAGDVRVMEGKNNRQIFSVQRTEAIRLIIQDEMKKEKERSQKMRALSQF